MPLACFLLTRSAPRHRAKPARLQLADRHVEAIGAQIIEPARYQVIAHRDLRVIEPAAAAFHFEQAI